MNVLLGVGDANKLSNQPNPTLRLKKIARIIISPPHGGRTFIIVSFLTDEVPANARTYFASRKACIVQCDNNKFGTHARVLSRTVYHGMAGSIPNKRSIYITVVDG